jgi:hypothetical protein
MKKALIKELLIKVKEGAGYMTIRDFIKDFNLSDIFSLSECNEKSIEWKLSEKKGHSFSYHTGNNFGW